MPQSKKRIILDTNIWISFLLTNNLTRLDDLIFSEKIELIFSQELLEEFVEVAKRPKFKRHFSELDIELVLLKIQNHADFIEVISEVSVCRDEKDNFLLSLSIDGRANFLITGDQDLLVLEEINDTKIVTISEFYGLL